MASIRLLFINKPEEHDKNDYIKRSMQKTHDSSNGFAMVDGDVIKRRGYKVQGYIMGFEKI